MTMETHNASPRVAVANSDFLILCDDITISPNSTSYLCKEAYAFSLRLVSRSDILTLLDKILEPGYVHAEPAMYFRSMFCFDPFFVADLTFADDDGEEDDGDGGDELDSGSSEKPTVESSQTRYLN